MAATGWGGGVGHQTVKSRHRQTCRFECRDGCTIAAIKQRQLEETHLDAHTQLAWGFYVHAFAVVVQLLWSEPPPALLRYAMFGVYHTAQSGPLPTPPLLCQSARLASGTSCYSKGTQR